MYRNVENAEKPMPDNLDEILHNQFITVGKRVRDLRIRRGLTQADLGKKIGIVPNYVCNIETARSHVSLTRLLKIAVALEVPVMDFFVESDERDFSKDISVSDLVNIAKVLKKK